MSTGIESKPYLPADELTIVTLHDVINTRTKLFQYVRRRIERLLARSSCDVSLQMPAVTLDIKGVSITSHDSDDFFMAKQALGASYRELLAAIRHSEQSGYGVS